MYERITQLATINLSPDAMAQTLGLSREVLRSQYHKALQAGYRAAAGLEEKPSRNKLLKWRAEAGDQEAIAMIERKREASKVWREKNKARVNEINKRRYEKIKALAKAGNIKAMETLCRRREAVRRSQKKANKNASK